MRQTAAPVTSELDQLCINTLRTLAIDAVQRANSGHPGAPMGMAPMAYVLWTRHMKHNPANPRWIGRDRFVLSAGHASMLLYGLLHLTGYDVSLDDLKEFRQWDGITPGHPEYGLTPGVETTTGPLGQGLGNGVGMALAQAHLAAVFGAPAQSVLEHYTYVFASDGDLMEGVSHEVASLAGHLGLGRLIVLYDDNRITIDGPTSLAWRDDVGQRFAAYGWHVLHVTDGNDLEAIDAAIEDARAEDTRPTLIVVRTHIGYGSPNKQDTSDAHGAPLGEDEVQLTKANLGWTETEPFAIPEDALRAWRQCLERGQGFEREWDEALTAYAASHPTEADELARRWEGKLPEGWEDVLPDLSDAGAMATRKASGLVINAIADTLPELVGGSADLAGSNNTTIKDGGDLSADNLAGRNIYYGVREHAMGSVMNGLALHGGVVPFGGTFLVFSDYMRPPIRLAALMEQKVIYVFTHDSIGLGEDGPTHQPIEMLAALRAIPNLLVVRPADAPETAEAWRLALAHERGPVALILTRQKVPAVDRTTLASATGLQRGAYVLAEASTDPQVVILATGSEVAPALDARDQLESEGVSTRVVSAPCLERFAEEPRAYRDSVLPPDVTTRIAVEAAHPMPWYRWIGTDGAVVGIERFGASAPYEKLFHEFDITAERVVREARELLAR